MTNRQIILSLAAVLMLLFVIGYSVYKNEQRRETIARTKVISDATGKGLTEEQIGKMLDKQ